MSSGMSLSGVPEHRCVCCNGQLPDDELVVPESASYLVHFCGLDCYEKWRGSAMLVQPDLADSPTQRR